MYPEVTILNTGSATAAPVDVTCELKAPNGKTVGKSSRSSQKPPSPGGNTTLTLPVIKIAGAALWSPDSPTLYSASCTLSSGDATGTIRLGVRKPEWDPNTGFSLNGVSMKILGAANHQDFAGVGVAIPDHLQWHRVQKLKDMGGNGWRTAHNCPTEALLDACDELGFLVWDENHRNGQDDELRRLVLRDRNHPSIVIWSVLFGWGGVGQTRKFSGSEHTPRRPCDGLFVCI